MKKRICFLVGSISISGGTYVIFQHASYLQDNGYDVTLAVQEAFTEETSSWHDCGKKLRCIPFDQARGETYDLVIATWWKTALELAGFSAPRYGYFVQSIESRFYPESEVPLRALVDSTYRLPVSYITEAKWIGQHLKLLFGQNATLVRNGIRKDIYTEVGPTIAARSAERPRVLIEGHFNVAFKNTALALRLAKKAGAKDIWVLTGSPIESIPGVSRVFSRVLISKTPEIYRSCDILVKLSTVEGMFGPPLEMFHCGGTAIVFDVTGHDEYIEDQVNAIVVKDKNTKKVVSELRQIISDTAYMEMLKKGAKETANSWPDWAHSSSLFAEWTKETLAAEETNRQEVEEIVKKAWEVYAVDEKERLIDDPWIERKYKMAAYVRSLPPGGKNMLKKVISLKEIFFSSDKVS